MKLSALAVIGRNLEIKLARVTNSHSELNLTATESSLLYVMFNKGGKGYQYRCQFIGNQSVSTNRFIASLDSLLAVRATKKELTPLLVVFIKNWLAQA